jgi:hypothetical protein
LPEITFTVPLCFATAGADAGACAGIAAHPTDAPVKGTTKPKLSVAARKMPDLVVILLIFMYETKNHLSAFSHSQLLQEDANGNAKVSAEQRFHAEPGTKMLAKGLNSA